MRVPADVASPPGTKVPTVLITDAKRRLSLYLVFACTVLGAGAQVLMKIGASNMDHPTLAAKLLSMIANPPLLAGYCLYGLSTVLLVLALRHGQLSILYPVIALTYVWVSILSVAIFHERMTPLKIAGVAIIVIGVAVLGRTSKS